MAAQDPSTTVDPGQTDAGARYDDLVVVPRRRPWRWVAIVITALALAAVGYSFVTNRNYEWPVVWQYLFDPRILGGLQTTVILTLVGMVLASVLGLGLAVMRQSPSTYLRTVSGAYVWLFRGTPVLVQLIFWYNAAILVPKVAIGIPFGPTFWSADTNSLINPWTAAILGLSLNEAAYLCEIIRSGIVSVDRGQSEAASALGMSRSHAFRRIVLPQALRVIVPPAANEFLGLLKYSSVVSVIALPELLYSAQLIYGQNYETIPLLLVVCIWYLVVVTILGWFQTRLERRLGVGFARTATGAASNGRWTRWVRSNR